MKQYTDIKYFINIQKRRYAGYVYFCFIILTYTLVNIFFLFYQKLCFHKVLKFFVIYYANRHNLPQINLKKALMVLTRLLAMINLIVFDRSSATQSPRERTNNK